LRVCAAILWLGSGCGYLPKTLRKKDFFAAVERRTGGGWTIAGLGLSEGYPHFIQQFSYCAFEEDKDGIIDDADVQAGAFRPEGGAIQQLGLKYYEDPFFGQISSEEYRKVLRAMSVHLDGWVDKITIRKETGLRDSTLANALRALKSKNIIVPKRGRKGIYRLPTKSFAVWIRAFTQVPEMAPSSTPET
jgi:hypothetical protein